MTDKHVLLSVALIQDAGYPLSYEIIYSPRQRLSTKHSGTGLGMKIIKDQWSMPIVDTFTVESHEGRGTTFFVRLPIHRPQAADTGLTCPDAGLGLELFRHVPRFNSSVGQRSGTSQIRPFSTRILVIFLLTLPLSPSYSYNQIHGVFICIKPMCNMDLPSLYEGPVRWILAEKFFQIQLVLFLILSL